MDDSDLYTLPIYLAEMESSLKLSITESIVNMMKDLQVDILFTQMTIAAFVNKDPYFPFRYLGFFLKTNKGQHFVNYLALRYTDLFLQMSLKGGIYRNIKHMLTEETESILNGYSFLYFKIYTEIENMNECFEPNKEFLKVINSIDYCSPDEVD